jgi:broad specificity phosphatase PhoE
MNKHLILIRHAAPEINSKVSSNRWKLSDAGRQDAAKLARELSAFSIGVVVSSTEPKALETAGFLADAFDLAPEVHSGIHEHDRAHVPFLLEQDFKETMGHLFANPDKLIFGSETANEAGKRFEKALYELLVRYPEDTLAVVSHGTVLTLFLAKHLKSDPYDTWLSLAMPEAIVLSRPDLSFMSRIRLTDRVP